MKLGVLRVCCNFLFLLNWLLYFWSKMILPLIFSLLPVVSTYSGIEDHRHQLQNLIGETPKVRIESFINWSKSQKIDKVLVVRPESLEHVQAVVQGCQKLALHIRAVGSKHTSSPVFTDPEQVVLYTRQIRRHDGPQIELLQGLRQKEINVMTGVTVQELHDFQLSHDVVIPCMASALQATLGGDAALFTHGHGSKCRSLAERITKMRIVDSRGRLQTYSMEKDGSDVMRAIRTNLGLFGIIYDMNVEVDKSGIVCVDNIWVPVGEFLKPSFLSYLFTKNFGVGIFWIPFESIRAEPDGRTSDLENWDPRQDRIHLMIFNTFDRDIPPTPIETDLNLNLTATSREDVLKNLGLTPYSLKQQSVLARLGGAQGTSYQLFPRAVHSDLCFSLDDDCSWAVDAGRNFEHVKAALESAMKIVQKRAMEGQFPLNIGVLMRMIPANDMYLSPAQAGLQESGQTLIIDAMSESKTPGFAQLTTDLFREWSKLPGAAPHWAKHWHQTEGIDDYLMWRYKEQFFKFLDVLEKSGADPDGIFFNVRLEKIMLPGGHQGFRKLKHRVNSSSRRTNPFISYMKGVQ